MLLTILLKVPAAGLAKPRYKAELIRYAYIDGLWVNPEEVLDKWPYSIVYRIQWLCTWLLIPLFQKLFETHEGEFKSIKWIFP